MYVDETDHAQSSYDMIIGRDLLFKLGMDVSFSTGLMTWANAQVPMKNISCFWEDNIDEHEKEVMFMHDPETT